MVIMKRGKLGLILLIAVVLMVMVGAIFWLGSNVLAGGGKKTATTEQQRDDSVLRNPKGDTRVTLNVRGPVVAKENRYAINIELTAASRKLYVYRGYDNEVLEKIEMDNNEQSFKDFLLALSDNGYTITNKVNAKRDNGVCSTGQLINFGLFETKDKQVLDSWTTSCGVAGNFGGDSGRVIALILNQFPDGKQKIDDAFKKIDEQKGGVLSLTF